MSHNINENVDKKLDQVCALLKELDQLDNTLTDSIYVILLLLNRSRKINTSEIERMEFSFKMLV